MKRNENNLQKKKKIANKRNEDKSKKLYTLTKLSNQQLKGEILLML